MLLPLMEAFLMFAGAYATFVGLSTLFLSFGVSLVIPYALPFVIAAVLGIFAYVASISLNSVRLLEEFQYPEEKIRPSANIIVKVSKKIAKNNNNTEDSYEIVDEKQKLCFITDFIGESTNINCDCNEQLKYLKARL